MPTSFALLPRQHDPRRRGRLEGRIARHFHTTLRDFAVTATSDTAAVDSEQTSAHTPADVQLTEQGVRDVRATNVTISQGGARDIDATTVSITQGGAGRVRATELTVFQGGVGLARTERLKLKDGGSAGVVMATEATVAKGGRIGLLIARSTSGEVRPLLDWRTAAALAAGLVVFGIVRRR
jgi:hypothetical protein